ncbi:hypothetical protein SDC9_178615 [bioreactor metagenome]|uniref:Uncharacterized protein n=1 Tax=bioreactor metagenome TaxID=1076179 RepID=A0A645GW83_9ZZZZ
MFIKKCVDRVQVLISLRLHVNVSGKYGWGDGEWMRNWEQDLIQSGALLPEGYLIINETPDQEGIENCKSYGANLVK